MVSSFFYICMGCLVLSLKLNTYRISFLFFSFFFVFGFRMDEMMRGQRGWRELAVLGDKINKFTGMIEGLIWSPRGGDLNDQEDDWAFEEVISHCRILQQFMVP